jgi:hypothetical protein
LASSKPAKSASLRPFFNSLSFMSLAPSDNPHPKGRNSAPPLCHYKISFSNEIEARNLDLLPLIADDSGSPLFVPVYMGEQEILVFIEIAGLLFSF